MPDERLKEKALGYDKEADRIFTKSAPATAEGKKWKGLSESFVQWTENYLHK